MNEKYPNLTGGGMKPGETIRDAIRDKRRKATKVFSFTLHDVAEAIGRSLFTVKRAIHDQRLNPRDLISLSAYVFKNAKEAKMEEKEEDVAR